MSEVVLWLPHLNAVLNLTAACLLVVAYYHIRQKNKVSHSKYMKAVLLVWCLFMASYLIYHSQVGYLKFNGEGLVRPLYFIILTSHVVLAALIVPLVLISVYFALRANFEHHHQWGRWTLPISIYVSISGIIVYLMAFHLYPPPSG